MSYFHLDDEPFPCCINKVYKCENDIVFATDKEEAKFISSCEDVVELTGKKQKLLETNLL